MLSNVIYTDTPKVKINSFKVFEQGYFEEGIHVTSGLVNDFKVKDVVTKSTDQEIALTELHGDIIFQHLDLVGLFDSINVTDLEYNSIKTWGDQYTEASLVFTNDVSEVKPELLVQHLQVIESLNDVNVENFISIDEPLEINGKVFFKTLESNDCLVYGNIQSGNILNGVSIDEFDQTRLSLTRAQKIPSGNIQNLHITGFLKNDLINGIDTNTFTDRIIKSQSVRNLLFSGEILIDTLHVTGNVVAKFLNGRDLDQLIEDAVWLKHENRLPGSFTFLDSVVINKNFSAYGFVNGQILGRFVNDLVLKNQNPIILSDAKIFKNGFHVLGNVNPGYINTNPIDSFVFKSDKKALYGPVSVYGKVIAKDVDIHRSLNNISVNYFKQTYDYDSESKVHVIKGDVNFHQPLRTKHLIVHGAFNDIPNLNNFIDSIVRDDKNAKIFGHKTFVSSNNFESGFDVKHFNGQNLSALVSEIVVTDQLELIRINGAVRFTEPVSVPNVKVHRDLATHNIADCSPIEWHYNSLLIDRNEVINGKFKIYLRSKKPQETLKPSRSP